MEDAAIHPGLPVFGKKAPPSEQRIEVRGSEQQLFLGPDQLRKPAIAVAAGRVMPPVDRAPPPVAVAHLLPDRARQG